MGNLNYQNPGALRDGGFVILKTPGPYEMQGPGDGDMISWGTPNTRFWVSY